MKKPNLKSLKIDSLKTKRIKNSMARNYDDFLQKELKDLKFATEYLNACFEDTEEVFLSGLKRVVEAMSKSAKLKELNIKKNLKFSELTTILQAIGITINFQPQLKKKKAS